MTLISSLQKGDDVGTHSSRKVDEAGALIDAEEAGEEQTGKSDDNEESSE